MSFIKEITESPNDVHKKNLTLYDFKLRVVMENLGMKEPKISLIPKWSHKMQTFRANPAIIISGISVQLGQAAKIR